MSVGWAPRAVRVSSRAPSCSSSRATRRDSTGLDRPMRSAARANEPVSTTRTKDRTSTRSVDERSIFCNPAMSDGRLPATLLADYMLVINFIRKGRRDVNILVINSSANGDASASNGLAGRFADFHRDRDPAANIVLRDVGANPLPHLTAETVAAIKGTPATSAELEARKLSDAL